MEKIGTYPGLYNFLKDNEEEIIEYLTNNIERNSIYTWNKNSVLSFRKEVGPVYRCDAIIIRSMKENDYKSFLRAEYPYSWYEHCSVDYNDILSGQQPWTGPNSSYGDGLHQSNSLHKHLLDFFLIKQRDNKINQILK